MSAAISSNPPTLTAVSYDANTGVFTFSGSNLQSHGSGRPITLGAFKLYGNGTYPFGGKDVLGNFSATGFTVTLSSADHARANAVLDANGTQDFAGSLYNLGVKAKWDGAGSPAIAALGVSTSGYNALLGQLQDPGIRADLVTQVGNDALNYAGMLKILDDVAAKGSVTAAEFHDLTTLVADFNTAGGIQVSAYLADISNKLVNGDPANATWTGGAAAATPLGDLAVGSSAIQLRELVQKWFLGGDLPAAYADYQITATHYAHSASPLYNHSGLPAITDVDQGHVNDCYFMAALGEVALCAPAAIQAMLTDNGNGSYGVRFYDAGTASYVTVNRMLLHESSGALLANRQTGHIWANLLENAFVEFYGSGLGNAWNQINGGYPADALQMITGHSTYTYDSSLDSGYAWSGLQQSLVQAMQNKAEVILNCYGDATDGKGRTTFVADHAFCFVGYDSRTGDFILRNPWGTAAGQNWDTTFEASLADMQNLALGQITSSVQLNGSNPQEPVIASGFSLPGSLAAAGNGNVYVADDGSGSIAEIAHDTYGVSTLATGFKTITGLAMDAGGNLYVSDSGHGTLSEIAAGSDTPTTLLSNVYASSIAADAAGDLFVATQIAGIDTIVEISAGNHATQALAEYTAADGLSNLAADSAGNLYFSTAITGGTGTRFSVDEIAAGSGTITSLTSMQGYGGGSVAVDAAGNVYFSVSVALPNGAGNTGALAEIAIGSNTVTTLDTGVNASALAVDAAGNLYLTDSASQVVEVLNASRIAAIPVQYAFDQLPASPVLIQHYFQGTAQIELAKSAFTALANAHAINNTNFKNAAKATGPGDYLYYDRQDGGVFYAAHHGSQPIEIAVIGQNSHPAALTAADFTLV